MTPLLILAAAVGLVFLAMLLAGLATVAAGEPDDGTIRCTKCRDEIAYQASRVRWVHTETGDPLCADAVRSVATPPRDVEIG